MAYLIPDIRGDERRALMLSFGTLLLAMSSHALLETARDTFFLSTLPATRLPWVYLAIAAASLLITWVRQKRPGGVRKRVDLASFLGLAAVVNVLFMFGLVRMGTEMVYALYVWSGVFSTLAVVQFWNLINAAFTVVQAKRLFAFIGVGGVVGAIIGSGVAGAISTLASPPMLLLAAAAAAAAAAGAAVALGRVLSPAEEASDFPGADETKSLWEPLAQVRRSPYLKRLGMVVGLSAFALTLADYIFKDAVAASVATEDLGTFFSTTYFGLNVLSLLVQVFLVNWLMRTFGVSPLLAVLPTLVGVGVAGVALGGGLVAALAMKTADGTLRYSLHRTVVEVLYVPLHASLRSRVKELLEVLGQRGGQAVASIVILALAALGGERWVLAVAIGSLVAWIAVALEVRPHYLNLFRERIEASTLASQIALPKLDLASLEALIGALNSPVDDEVMAAMDLLAVQHRVNLIPALILYHPSTRVVRRAIRLFTGVGRNDFLPIVERLVGHVDPEVRASVLRARTRDLDDVTLLREALEDTATIVRATAVAGLAAARGCGDDDVASTLDELLSRGTSDSRLALARAIGDRPDPVCAWILVKLADDPNEQVRLAAARAMRSLPPDSEYLGPLIRMLGNRNLRPEARASLVAMGNLALPAIGDAMDDLTLDRSTRLHLPRTLCLLDAQPASEVLLRRIPDERDGAIQFKLLRGLAVLKTRDPNLSLDADRLDELMEQSLDDACHLLRLRAELSSGLRRQPERSTPALAFMGAILAERERYAIDRLFRYLHLRDQGDDFAHIQRGLSSDNARVQASSRELLEARVSPDIRDRVLVLLDDVDVDERATRLAAVHRTSSIGKVTGVDGVLGWVLRHGGSTLKLFGLYEVATSGLRELKDAVTACDPAGDDEVERERERVLSLLGGAMVAKGANR